AVGGRLRDSDAAEGGEREKCGDDRGKRRRSFAIRPLFPLRQFDDHQRFTNNAAPTKITTTAAAQAFRFNGSFSSASHRNSFAATNSDTAQHRSSTPRFFRFAARPSPSFITR